MTRRQQEATEPRRGSGIRAPGTSACRERDAAKVGGDTPNPLPPPLPTKKKEGLSSGETGHRGARLRDIGLSRVWA